MTKLTLASTSTYRKNLLERLRIPFDCVSPLFDEESQEPANPVADKMAIEFAKGKALSLTLPGLILGSDQVVEFEGKILGKPGTHEKAVEQLTLLSAKTHRLFTAVALVKNGQVIDQCLDLHEMTLRALESDEIVRYVNADKALDCCGAYKIESLGISLFEAVKGDDFTAITGLPLISVARMLRKQGFSIP